MRPRLLDHLEIPSPCPMRWEQMHGDTRQRFCDRCQHSVHNLSAMTERDINALFARAEGRVCGGFQRDPFGRIIVQPERGWRSWLKRRIAFVKLAISSGLAALVATPAHGQSGNKAPPSASADETNRSLQPGSSATPQSQSPDPTPSPVIVQKLNEETIQLQAFGMIVCKPPTTPPQKAFAPPKKRFKK